MKSLNELTFGFSDAENYRRRENKDLFSQIFLRTNELKNIKKENIYFLIGEKGTGKTAYAVYLTNDYDDKLTSNHYFIRETDYQKFISLKDERHLIVSDYVDIWKCILLLLTAGAILEKSDRFKIRRGTKNLSKLRKVMEEYHDKAFSPEIVFGLQLVENIEVLSELAMKHGLISGKSTVAGTHKVAEERRKFQTTLSELIRAFQSVIGEFQLSTNFCMFVDGIDIRPEIVSFEKYLECVKGLANAAWSLNNDFFANIKDTSGKCKIVLLLRPDIFNSLGLQNRNTKLRDNSIILDWRTNYRNYRTSDLFNMADKFLSSQQDSTPIPGAAWDYYFPFDASSFKKSDKNLSGFIVALRYTYHRPRDLLAIFKSLNELYVATKKRKDYFEATDLLNADFRRSYGGYLLGEIKDALSFYYDESEYEAFLKFFEYLNGKISFSYDDFLEAFSSFSGYYEDQNKELPSFMTSPEELLQFLYDQNVICYIEHSEGIESEKFIRWCFKERSPSNINPKVQTHRDYEIHYGLSSALNMGKEIKKRGNYKENKTSKKEEKYYNGEILRIAKNGDFGFIKEDNLPIDIFFHKKEINGRVSFAKGTRVRFNLTKDRKGRLVASNVTEIKRS